VKFTVADHPVFPFLQRDHRAFQRDGLRTPQQNQGWISVLDDTRAAVFVEIDDSEGGVTDLALFADGQRVHDGPGALAHVDKGGRVSQGHGRGEIGEHACFDAAAQAVREHRNDAPFLPDFPGKKDIA
jgi:hypothetical protein